MTKTISSNVYKGIGAIALGSILSFSLFACATPEDNTNKNTDNTAITNTNKNDNTSNDNKNTVKTDQSSSDLSSIPLIKKSFYTADSFQIDYTPDIESTSPTTFTYNRTITLAPAGTPKLVDITFDDADGEKESVNYEFNPDEQGFSTEIIVNDVYEGETTESTTEYSYDVKSTSTGYEVIISSGPAIEKGSDDEPDGADIKSNVSTFYFDKDGTLEKNEIVATCYDGSILTSVSIYDEEGNLTKITRDDTFKYTQEDIEDAQENGEELPDSYQETLTFTYDDDQMIMHNVEDDHDVIFDIVRDENGNITNLKSDSGKTSITIHYKEVVDGSILGYIDSVSSLDDIISTALDYSSSIAGDLEANEEIIIEDADDDDVLENDADDEIIVID